MHERILFQHFVLMLRLKNAVLGLIIVLNEL